MEGSNLKSVRQMQAGQSGKIVSIQGGHGIVDRLYSMGIRPGKKVTKVSSMLMRGPVTLQVGRTQIAVGYGMADKIVVELE